MSNFNRFSQKGKLKVVDGSIIQPEYAGLRFVINLISISGKPEGEVYTAFDKKWKKIREEVKGWYSSRVNWKYGEISSIPVQSDTWVINCLCREEDGKINEDALMTCVKKLVSLAKSEKASIHLHQSLQSEYSGLNSILEESFINDGINVSIYLKY